MQYNKTFTLRNGLTCTLRNATPMDSQDVIDNFILTHAQTDYLLTYADEAGFTRENEADFLSRKLESENEAELVAVVNGAVVGTAGISAVGSKYKIRHRAELGISISKAYWGLGIGRAMMDACMELARQAGFHQLELEAVASNERALELYRKMGFVEYGRNPLGFLSRENGYQELVYMRLVLDRA